MPWMRWSVLLLMVSLIGLTNGCGNSKKRTAKPASETTSETPDGVYWEGQTDSNSGQTTRSVTPKNRGIHPYDQVGQGETYAAIVARLGPPTHQSLLYIWTTMAGKFAVAFDAQQNAHSLNTSGDTSPEREQEIRGLVEKQVSFTAMTAHLGSSPTIAGGQAVWNGQDGRALYVTFGDGKVIRAEHGAVMPNPLP